MRKAQDLAADDSGQENGNRATVALVDAKVDTVLAEVRGGFKDVQRQLDLLAGLPVAHAALEKVVQAQGEDIAELKRAEDRRAIHWPTFLVSLLALCAAAYAALT